MSPSLSDPGCRETKEANYADPSGQRDIEAQNVMSKDGCMSCSGRVKVVAGVFVTTHCVYNNIIR